tara:strand:+ start:237 stop:1136 length:900 start_codon:yes stop_codon:yes gene_type:complete
MRIALTTVVRAAKQGDVHGGFYVIDYPSKEVLFHSTCKEDFGGDNERGGERGLRGVCVVDDKIYVAGSSSISIVDSETFKPIASRHDREYLDSIHEICYHDDHIWLTSTGQDCIVKLDMHLNMVECWHIIGVQHDSHHTVANKVKVDSTSGLEDKIHVNSISAHNNRLVFAGALTPLYDFETLEEVQDLAIGGFTHNFEEYPDLVLANKTYVQKLEVVSGYDRVFYAVPDYMGKMEQIDDEIAKANWIRGMVRKDNLVFIGSSPARILVFDLDRRAFIDEIKLSSDPRCCVHGIDLLGV